MKGWRKGYVKICYLNIKVRKKRKRSGGGRSAHIK